MVIKMDIIKIKLNDEKEQSLNSIKEILEEACFLKKRVEVVIEIDFKPESNFIYRIFTLFFDYESCFLKSILYVNKSSVDVLKITLRAEDELFIKTPTIIIGDVHKDAIIHVYSSLYISGVVEGQIYLYKGEGSVFIEECHNVRLTLNNDLIRILNGKKIYFDNQKGDNKLWRELSL